MTGMLRTQVERALGELAGAGLVTADSFSGLRALLTPPEKRSSLSGRASARQSAYGVDTAGAVGVAGGCFSAHPRAPSVPKVEMLARALLKRYGVVFRSLLARESGLPTWRELAAVYRRLEARGEIRGGRFVSGFGGEQFALAGRGGPAARGAQAGEERRARRALRAPIRSTWSAYSRPMRAFPPSRSNRVLFRDGLAIAALEGGEVRRLAHSDLDDDTLRGLLVRRTGVQPARSHLRGSAPRKGDATQKKRIYAASVR